MDNNYYNYETANYDAQSVDKYKNITNVSQVRNYYIMQPSSNEFIFKCNKVIWGLFGFFLMSSGILTLLICLTIFDLGGQIYIGGMIIGFAFAGFLVVLAIRGLSQSIIRQKVILTDEYIEIKSYYLLFCFDSNKKYDYTVVLI